MLKQSLDRHRQQGNSQVKQQPKLSDFTVESAQSYRNIKENKEYK